MKIYIMDKSFETLKEYENFMKKLYPSALIKYCTHYSDIETLVKDDIPNLVILDGDSNYGIITAKKIKEINKNIKVIISSVNNKLVFEVYQNNLNGFIIKPFTIDTLKESIK